MIGNDRILLYEWADFSVIVYRDFQEREVQHMLTTIKPKKKTLILYLLVPVLMFVFTVFVPLVTALVYSFFEWKGGPQKTFNGLANYVQLVHDSTFWQSFGHNLYLVIACIIGQIGIAFILVLMVFPLRLYTR